ncbi:MAG: hypothetical protein QOK49_1414 [Baekduia sp.]|jgi:hypothetical protein|nr:hypothetical protein [Baekduia sp.]
MSLLSHAQVPKIVAGSRDSALDRPVIAYLLLAVAFLVPAAAFWPGVLSPDSNQTLYQAASHFSSDWWTAFGAITLRFWLENDLGFGFVYAAALTTVVTGLYLCLRPVLRRVPAATATLVIVVFPPVLAQISALSRDTFFLGSTLVALGLMAARPQSPANRRRTLLVAAVVAALVAFWCRQNGVIVLLLVAAWAVWPASADATGRARALALLIGVGAVLATVIGTTLLYSAFGVRRVHAERTLFVYDLASISEQTGHDQFPRWMQTSSNPAWVTPPVDQSSIERRFDAKNVISLYPDNRAGTIDFGSTEIASAESKVLRHVWIRSIRHHPLEYLWGRVRVTVAQLGIGDRPDDAFLPRQSADNYGQPLLFPGDYRAAKSYVTTFVNSSAAVPTDLPWLYLGLSVGLAGLLWRRVRSRLAAALGLLVAAQFALLAMLAMGASFRYTAIAVPAALLLLVHVFARTSAGRRFARTEDAPA